jgi:L-threonylcarbamoyladenylate synthase
MIVEATPENIARAAQLIVNGEIVSFPTETVYGLGSNALDKSAVAKIFKAKQRPSYNPLIVHVTDAASARKVLSSWPATAQLLAEKFWPGPLTLVLPKSDNMPDNVTAGLPTVGVRVPNHPVTQALLQAANVPIAAPSANTFMHISPTRAEHVLKSLGELVPLILDGGAVPIGIESTVISLCEATPVLLRPGAVTREQLETVIGPIDEAKVLSVGEARHSPGMLERHYAPRVPAFRFESDESTLAAKCAFVTNNCGALIFPGSTLIAEYMVPMPANAAAYAQKLYASLHELEDADCDEILVEMPPDTPGWRSVRDRLQRATQELRER